MSKTEDAYKTISEVVKILGLKNSDLGSKIKILKLDQESIFNLAEIGVNPKSLRIVFNTALVIFPAVSIFSCKLFNISCSACFNPSVLPSKYASHEPW